MKRFDNSKVSFNEIINDAFQEMLRSNTDPSKHFLFDSHRWWTDEFLPQMPKYKIADNLSSIDDDTMNRIKNEFEYDNSKYKLHPVNNCKFIPNKTISSDELDRIYDKISNPDIKDFNDIRDAVTEMFDYNLPSTIKNLDDLVKQDLNKSNRKQINVIISGAGPIGLYTALYLDQYYNGPSNPLKTYINILLLDNRIYKEGVKLPYSRNTQFGFDIQEIQPFINQVFCWRNRSIMGTRQFDFIYVLENMLYLAAFKRGIPMYFTKSLEDYESLKKFATKHGYQYIFDCTGGRLNPPFKPTLKWNKYNMKDKNMELKSIDNIYKLFVDGKEFKHTVFLIRVMDKDMRPYHIGNLFIDIDNSDDLKLVEKFNNVCLTVDEYIILSKHFKNDEMRYLYPLVSHEFKADAKYVKIVAFDVKSYHAKQCAYTINDDLMYIALGNTTGSSELGIYFGLRYAIMFSKHICNLLSTFTP